ncbi:unnamed protein product, partial [Rotaria sp. Silwood2]
MDERIITNPCRQIISLTLNNIQIPIDILESILCATPSLLYLDLTSQTITFEFLQHLCRWENFIPIKLPLLRQFDFSFFCFNFDSKEIESLVSSFRTPFWLQEKHWFITCEYKNAYRKPELGLFSSSRAPNGFPFGNDFYTISSSTSTTMDDDEGQTNSVWRVRVNLGILMEERAHKI